jgi:YggT family protein
MTTLTTTSLIVSLGLGLMSLLLIFRIVLTWYPQINLNQFPVCLVAWPTEPLLAPLRKVIPPMGGVDITPIVWFGIFSLLREFLVGQQGILKMLGG